MNRKAGISLKLSVSTLLMIAILPFSAHAKQKSTLEIGVINNFLFGAWATGSGSLTNFNVHCVASSNYSDSFSDPPPVETPPVVRSPYNLKVIDKATAAGYHIYLGGDATLTGNARIAVSFVHSDIAVASGSETLVDDVYDSHSHVGRYRLCKDGDNSRLDVNISSTDLEQAQAGTYRGYFTAQALGGSSGTDTDSNDFRVDLSIANIVRVSALDDIHIGDYFGGVGNLFQEETFCMYSNNAGASYTVTITGTNQDINGNFFVINPSASALLPYVLQFKSDVTAGPGTTVTTAALNGVGSNTSSVCNGVDNAKLSLTVLAADMQAAIPDSYSDTLTLLVAPL